MDESGIHRPPPNPNGNGMYGALSLTGLDEFSPQEKAQRVAAVANDITASIIYVAKHAEAGNLTSEQLKPIHNLIDMVNVVGREHNRRLERELAEQDRQVEEMRKKLEEQSRQIGERRHVCRAMRKMDVVIGELKASVEVLETEIKKMQDDRGTWVMLRERIDLEEQ
ncbi:hypothetical protein PAAG_03501 [Paracoccidioides lutzii Pb01]|uniref:Uncharacterized protein n=1 Tax=Paracoccidioides lutzii (strain ATCC MYA-826 / Pb01) TaxID=502779 RepID=C1GXC7_PARBA|nr:hypothetical protein PAAG_03501 [Paracoccidioides lutzii Pb01]EEH41215.1 hypothetical protein PAAG_03501 [Paracoccidioides lutzii Pb01]